jgi:uncharacterized protein YaaQ
MKMMIVIINDRDAESVMQALVDQEFRATRISSTGVFLRRGNTTLMIGLEEEKVDEALEIIKEHSSQPEEVDQRRATVFVLPVSRYEQAVITFDYNHKQLLPRLFRIPLQIAIFALPVNQWGFVALNVPGRNFAHKN